MILLYVMLYMSIFLHEMMHVILAKSFRIAILEVKIGTEWPQGNIGKLRISPVIGNSHVEVDYENLVKLSSAKKIMFFMAGIFMNLTLAFVFGMLNRHMDMFAIKIVAVSNLVIAILNLLPLWQTDMANLISLIGDKAKKQGDR